MGFLSIDANMFASFKLLILPIMKLEQHASKPAKVLRISRYARIANSFMLSVSHLHSQSVGAPTMYVQLNSTCCQYCYITLYLVWMPNWFVNSCRRRVQLQEWLPCIEHQGRRLSSQAAPCIGLNENSHVALANMRKRLTTRTSCASSRRALITEADFEHPALDLNLQSAT